MKPKRSGTKVLGDGDAWVNWWLFSPPLLPEDVRDFLEENDIERYYSHPGGAFTHRPSVRSTKTRTLITQYGGYDV